MGVNKVTHYKNLIAVKCDNNYGAHICTDTGREGAIVGTYELVPLADSAIEWGIAGIDYRHDDLTDEQVIGYVNRIAAVIER